MNKGEKKRTNQETNYFLSFIYFERERVHPWAQGPQVGEGQREKERQNPKWLGLIS